MLLAAVREVREDRQYYSVGALKLMMEQPAEAPGLEQLTPRERDALRAAGEGLSVRQTAERMQVSESTVKPYRQRVLRKLDLHDSVGLAQFELSAGLAAWGDWWTKRTLIEVDPFNLTQSRQAGKRAKGVR
jgi:DNA-binding NarL/FixJ family response regulator